MSIRSRILRWLGAPSYDEARSIALREIDADAVWRAGAAEAVTYAERRRQAGRDRDAAIDMGRRENTRV